MLIFLAFSLPFLHFFLHFCFMRSKIYDDVPKTLKTGSGRWVAIFPVNGNYSLYDPIAEQELGQILFDENDYWIYYGDILSVDEQEEIAGAINGHDLQMEQLLRSLNEDGE